MAYAHVASPPDRPVRFLHTSDLHIGSTLTMPGPQPLEVVAVLAAAVQREQADAVLIAGDFFDHRKVHEDIVAGAAADLSRIPLRYSNEGIPTLEEVLGLVSGRAALLIEIKDQDGAMGENVGTLELAVAADLARYGGPVAVMSFNPHSVAAFGRAAPRVPRGLTTAAYDAKHWPALPAATRDRLREIPDYDRLGATFVSHEARDLHRPRLAELKAKGATLLCWTIRSAEEEAAARRHADNVTFEGYLPALATA